MQKRELVNLFLSDEMLPTLKELSVKNGKKTSIEIDYKNPFGSKILLIHSNKKAREKSKISKIAFVYNGSNTVSGSVFYDFNEPLERSFSFHITVNEVERKHSIVVNLHDHHKIEIAKNIISHHMGIVALIGSGDLAISDEVNRKEKRKIERNNRKYPDFKTNGDTYKIIDISKQRHNIQRQQTEDNLIRQREHTRRGHYRHYKATGKIIWIDAYKAGDASLGIITKDYKI